MGSEGSCSGSTPRLVQKACQRRPEELAALMRCEETRDRVAD